MLELDTTIMTPAPVFDTSGHVARFADWMVKDTKTGDVLRADHLVKNVLEARLAGDKEARGIAAQPSKEDDKKRKKKAAKSAAVALDDATLREYEVTLAQVSPCSSCSNEPRADRRMGWSLITSLVPNWAHCAKSIVSKTQTPITRLGNLSNLI